MNSKILQISLVVLSVGIGCKTAQNAGSTENPVSIQGTWVYESQSSGGFDGLSPEQKPTLAFDTEKKSLSGTTGCNQVNGTFSVSGNTISFGPLAGTRKLCVDMRMEDFMNKFLPLVGTYKIEGKRLYLMEKDQPANFVVMVKKSK